MFYSWLEKRETMISFGFYVTVIALLNGTTAMTSRCHSVIRVTHTRQSLVKKLIYILLSELFLYT
jgi:vesicle coat complex subunit